MKPEINIKQLIKATTSKVFKAIANGQLFLSTGATAQTMDIDFKIGGQYKISWKEVYHCRGEFFEIVENKHILFSWIKVHKEFEGCQNTVVSITLKPIDETTTELHLTHSGFTTDDFIHDHERGWISSLAEFSKSIAAI